MEAPKPQFSFRVKDHAQGNKRIMRLSKPQMLIYNMDKCTGESVSVLCGSILLGKVVDSGTLDDIFNEIVKRNSALRTVLLEKEEVEQYCEAYSPLHYVCRSFLSIEEMDHFATEYAKKSLDIHGRLFEFIIISLPNNTGVLIKLHHIIGDAWTLSLLGKQLTTLLEGLEPLYGDYAHYIENEDSYLKSKRYERDKQYFLDCFNHIDEITYLSDSTSSNRLAHRKEMIIGAEETKSVRQYCLAHSISPFMLFTECLSILFSRLRNNADMFYLGVAILNRSNEEELNTVGMFVNTVPLLVNLDYGADFDTNLSRMKEDLLLVIRHQKYNYGDLLKDLRTTTNFRGQLYDIVLSYQNAKLDNSYRSIQSKWYPSGTQEESLQIHIDDRDNEGILRISYDYLADRFSEKQIERIHGYLTHILYGGMKDGCVGIGSMQILSEEERQALMFQFRGKTAEYPKDKCVHTLFEEHVRQHPSRTAIIASDQMLSYGSLNELANRVAASLQKRGVKPGDLVGIKLPRRSYYFAAVLGVLKSGAAYIPIVSDYPEDRIAYMVKDSQASLLIDEHIIGSLLSEESESNPDIPVSSEDKCYCRYTSGSTGNPKGVLVSHRNVMNLIFEMDRLEHVDVILGVTNVGFDMCVTENLYSFMTGKTLVFADENAMIDSVKLSDLIHEYKADMITTTPSKMKLYLNSKEMQAALGRLSVISFGGEKLNKDFLQSIRKLSDAVISNEYGPTETTCYSTSCIMRNEIGEVSIGKPIANTQVYIVDKYMNPTPIGVKGELCIAGDGVGLGYLNRPELTEEKFIPNPFGDGKLYRTGDIAYWNEGGNIIYLCRNDSQVKIRGLRIELGEIESAIMSISGIEQAVVIVRDGSFQQQILCAFYTGANLDRHLIKNHLGKMLPKYMIPNYFTHLSSIPMTSNGKIDKHYLSTLDLDPSLMESRYAEPHNEMETDLCDLVSQVLDRGRIGAETDFFEAGLDSLKAIEFTLKAKANHIIIPLQAVFEYPTVRDLGRYLNGFGSGSIVYSLDAFKKYDAILSKNVYSLSSSIVKRKLGTVVLTGSTGFLGSHILDQLLKEGANKVICIVRSEERLAKSLAYYFGDTYLSDIGTKIISVVADIASADVNHLCIHDHVDTVIHAAACVKHYGQWEDFERVNVGGTKCALEFAKLNRARFIHISTTSVRGNGLNDTYASDMNTDSLFFDERCLYVGQSLENVYIRSKFEAERVVLDAILDGLDAKIIRVGNLTNRNSDLRFQPNYSENAFLNRIRAWIGLGLVPDYLMIDSIEFSPVDVTALGVVKLAEYATCEQSVFHLYNSKFLSFASAIHLFIENGIAMNVVDHACFIQALTRMLDEPGKEWIYEAFQNDMDHDGRLMYGQNHHIINEFTNRFLQEIGFEWPMIDSTYVSNYIKYFKDLGYFL